MSTRRRLFRAGGWLVCLGVLLGACSQSTSHLPPPPPGTKAVSYQGLTIDVPKSWPVYSRPQLICTPRGPAIVVGPPPPPGQPVASCPAALPGTGVVTFGGPDVVVPVGREVRRDIHGVETAVSQATFPDGTENGTLRYVSTEVARFLGRGAWLQADEPGRAVDGALHDVDQVVGSVRPAG